MRVLASIPIEKIDLDKCLEFAYAQLETSSGGLYRARGEFRQEKMVNDIVVGKLGEIGVYRFVTGLEGEFSPVYRFVSAPDFSIYKGRRKSFDADVTVCFSDNEDLPQYKLHIKSQSMGSYEKYGASWICQRTDKLTYKPDPIDVLVFVIVDLDKGFGNILGMVEATTLFAKGLWGECKVPSYAKTKVALYFDKIEGALKRGEPVGCLSIFNLLLR